MGRPGPPGPLAIRTAWRVIDSCTHKNAEDGCCQHPSNPTPECHSAACPLDRPQTPDVRSGVRP